MKYPFMGIFLGPSSSDVLVLLLNYHKRTAKITEQRLNFDLVQFLYLFTRISARATAICTKHAVSYSLSVILVFLFVIS